MGVFEDFEGEENLRVSEAFVRHEFLDGQIKAKLL